MSDLTWHFPVVPPFVTQGTDATQYNFAREERGATAILVREVLQNALDARDDSNDAGVEVRIALAKPKKEPVEALKLLSALFSDEFVRHLSAATGYDVSRSELVEKPALVIEDFGTSGLLGSYEDSDLDGHRENWNAFWLREGEGAKRGGSNGGAGQGKVSLYKAGLSRIVLALTVRSLDKKSLVMAKANFLRDYRIAGSKKHARSAFLTTSRDSPRPSLNDGVAIGVRSCFSLSRLPEQPGLSVVIPAVGDFDEKEALMAVLLEFYPAICAGQLSVSVCSHHVTRDNVESIASSCLSDEEVVRRSAPFTSKYREFVQKCMMMGGRPIQVSDNWFELPPDSGELFGSVGREELGNRLREGECLSLRVPIRVGRKGKAAVIAQLLVHVALSAAGGRVEEAVLRKSLLIGGEQPLSKSGLAQPMMCLVQVSDPDLSDFLLSAEEPSHLHWNGAIAKEKGLYVNAEKTLRAVRQAAPRLIKSILGAVSQRDPVALNSYFPSTKPVEGVGGSEGGSGVGRTGPNPGGGGSGGGGGTHEKREKHFRFENGGGELVLVPATKSIFAKLSKPCNVELQCAYESPYGDAFSEFDPFDFDLRDQGDHPISLSGGEVVDVGANTLRVKVQGDDFRLSVGGFSPNLRLRARLRYGLPSVESNEDPQ